MVKIKQQLVLLESKITVEDKINKAISQGSLYWQIAHVLLVINGVITTLEKSDPALYKWKFNFPRLLVFTFNKIPRGKAKAPERVNPLGKITIESLRENIASAKIKVDELKNVKANSHFFHPFFGNLSLKQTIQFLEIHNQHHLEIIEDIIK